MHTDSLSVAVPPVHPHQKSCHLFKSPIIQITYLHVKSKKKKKKISFTLFIKSFIHAFHFANPLYIDFLYGLVVVIQAMPSRHRCCWFHCSYHNLSIAVMLKLRHSSCMNMLDSVRIYIGIRSLCIHIHLYSYTSSLTIYFRIYPYLNL